MPSTPGGIEITRSKKFIGSSAIRKSLPPKASERCESWRIVREIEIEVGLLHFQIVSSAVLRKGLPKIREPDDHGNVINATQKSARKENVHSLSRKQILGEARIRQDTPGVGYELELELEENREILSRIVFGWLDNDGKNVHPRKLHNFLNRFYGKPGSLGAGVCVFLIEKSISKPMIFRHSEAVYPKVTSPQRSSMNLDHWNLGHYRMYQVDAILKTHDAGIP
ncbi:hypothetical protein Tco_1103870 [Tanacetum coccineum]